MGLKPIKSKTKEEWISFHPSVYYTLVEDKRCPVFTDLDVMSKYIEYFEYGENDENKIYYK